MYFLEKIAENKIRTAIDRGELDDLPGQGKPLVFDDDVGVPAEVRTAYRILKNAGCVPAEIAQHAQVRQLEERLSQTGCETERASLAAKLVLLKIQVERGSSHNN